VVLGFKTLKQYLINYARSFIYSTTLPLHSLISIKCAYQLLEKKAGEIHESPVHKLHENIAYFRRKIQNSQWLESTSAIQSLIVPGNNEVRTLCKKIQDKDMDVRPIVSPTVPRGKERIRVCLHSYNTKDEIDLLFKTIDEA